MRTHHRFEEFNITFIGFPNTWRKISGVYRINNEYVGASTHIRRRIIQHMNLYLRGGCKHGSRIKNIFDNASSIIVYYESTNVLEKEKISKKYKTNIHNEYFYSYERY